MNIIEDEFSDLDDLDTFNNVLIPEYTTDKTENWSDIDDNYEHAVVVFQMIINNINCAYVFSGNRDGFYPGAEWSESEWGWWVDRKPIVYMEHNELFEIYDELEIPIPPKLANYDEWGAMLYLEEVLNNTSHSIVGNKLHNMDFKTVNKIIDGQSTQFESVLESVIREDEFDDLDDEDQFGDLELIPDSAVTKIEDWSDLDSKHDYSFALFQLIINNINCANVFSTNVVVNPDNRSWLSNLLSEPELDFNQTFDFEHSEFSWWINGEPLDVKTDDELLKIYDILEIPTSPYIDKHDLIIGLLKHLRQAAKTSGIKSDFDLDGYRKTIASIIKMIDTNYGLIIREDEFGDLDDEDQFGDLTFPSSVITEIEDWSDLDSEYDYSFVLLQLIIDDVRFAYVFSGNRNDSDVGLDEDYPYWEDYAFWWWIVLEDNINILDYMDNEELGKVCDTLEIPFVSDRDIDGILARAAKSVGFWMSTNSYDNLDDSVFEIIERTYNKFYGNNRLSESVIREDEFSDLDDEDQFGHYLELKPEDIISPHEFDYNGLRIQNLYGSNDFLINDYRYSINGPTLNHDLVLCWRRTGGLTSSWSRRMLQMSDRLRTVSYDVDLGNLTAVANILEIPYTDIQNEDEYNNIVRNIWDTIDNTFEHNKQLFQTGEI